MIRIDFDYLEQHFPRRPADAHKGTMGTLLSLTGSFGFAGAAILSAKAALRSGVGLHYQVLPERIYPLFGTAVHESVCVPVKGNDLGTLCKADFPTVRTLLEKATAVLIGCGMGNNESTADNLKAVLENAKCPVVIDADGINVLARHIDYLDGSKAPIILTPHVKEFSRLSGLSVADILRDPAKAAEDFSKEHKDITLVLKGHRTYIAKNGEVYENIAGNSGMAKGGSGDVLAGVIASLAAQGADPFEAAVMGVHIHALAGDIAAAKFSQTAMLPSDVIDCLTEVYAKIEDAIN
ncbi:MAG: NAD(P)H-hydrate dehydratase [Ruminococcus sp.]|uniref:NAD(P)H-hydrate dehydratase n=1 Tax=Ruminococcus sp. TaxID=41978 RepID=UPI0028737B36|nr:NAD(P)H-hydrate dehydratase [Ruminococcus sp.]MBQ3285828.1 NAD(P)H-hydrate dehydratase [Ruminococcus sp.]